MKRILSAVRRAVDDYGMIEDGDRIAVGVSAGKDSLTLVAALAALRRFYPKRFELGAVTVDMGFEPPCDFSAVREFCEGLDVPYHVVPTEIAKIVFDVRKEKNPCGLCAVLEAQNTGVPLIASAHAGSFAELAARPNIRLLQENRVFDEYILISRERINGRYSGKFSFSAASCLENPADVVRIC